MKTIHDARYQELIEKMIALRQERGVSQVDLGKRLGKPQSYVAKVENFDRRIDVVEFKDWLGALNANPDDVLMNVGWW